MFERRQGVADLLLLLFAQMRQALLKRSVANMVVEGYCLSTSLGQRNSDDTPIFLVAQALDVVMREQLFHNASGRGGRNYELTGHFLHRAAIAINKQT